ncbi:MAG: hypothetical protein QOI16_3655, partial [Pseudonocardiales bacterium]|nr:hypothetical protein [Pseudonocardiales bacterium]
GVLVRLSAVALVALPIVAVLL